MKPNYLIDSLTKVQFITAIVLSQIIPFPKVRFLLHMWQESSGNGGSSDKMLDALANIGASTTAIRQDLEKVKFSFIACFVTVKQRNQSRFWMYVDVHLR